MLRPAVNEILKDGQSYYSLVIAVAKRARQIAQEAEEEHIVLTEKPVKIAVNELAAGKYKSVEPEHIRFYPMMRPAWQWIRRLTILISCIIMPSRWSLRPFCSRECGCWYLLEAVTASGRGLCLAESRSQVWKS